MPFSSSVKDKLQRAQRETVFTEQSHVCFWQSLDMNAVMIATILAEGISPGVVSRYAIMFRPYKCGTLFMVVRGKEVYVHNTY